MKKKGGEQTNANLAQQIQNEYNLYETSPTENRLLLNQRKQNMKKHMNSFFEEKKKELITKIKEERNLYNSSPTFNALSNNNKTNIQSELNRLNKEKKKVEEEIRIRKERLSKINEQRKICQKLKNINNEQNEKRKRDPKYYPGNEYFNIAREKALTGNSPFLQTR